MQQQQQMQQQQMQQMQQQQQQQASQQQQQQQQQSVATVGAADAATAAATSMPADGAAAANVTANVSTDLRVGQITTIPEDAQLANATVDASTKTKEQMEAELAALNAETLSQAVEKRRQE